MGYRGSLDYLYGLQRFGIKLGLDNIRTLLERLGHPERAFGIVHVAGTNGKGSVCACLATIFRAARLRAGLYTSPHLHSFTERLRVDLEPVAEADVVRLTDKLRACGEGIPLTFFEFTTAMALEFFRERKVGWAVLEVGMGGRLDATNAVHPDLCVITRVGLDHREHLGSTLAEVAGEKAGIIKPGVPVVCSLQEPETLEVIEDRARQCGAPLFLAGRDFASASDLRGMTYRGLDRNLGGLPMGLEGGHQRENLALALVAGELLIRRGVPLDEDALCRGVAQVRWPGRLEWWLGERKVLLDGAHNEDGARALADYLASAAISGVRLVVGMKGDKAAEAMLSRLLPHALALYCAPPPVDLPAAPESLAATAQAAGVPARTFPRVADAMEAALRERRDGEVVVVAGSLFLVAAAREYLMEHEDRP